MLQVQRYSPSVGTEPPDMEELYRQDEANIEARLALRNGGGYNFESPNLTAQLRAIVGSFRDLFSRTDFSIDPRSQWKKTDFDLHASPDWERYEYKKPTLGEQLSQAIDTAQSNASHASARAEGTIEKAGSHFNPTLLAPLLFGIIALIATMYRYFRP